MSTSVGACMCVSRCMHFTHETVLHSKLMGALPYVTEQALAHIF